MIRTRPLRARALLVCTVLLIVALATPLWLRAEGSRSLFPAASSAFRANLEWRTSVYGSSDSPDFNLFRRTLLKLYAREGEFILLGSSGIGLGEADIRVFNPGQVTGRIGRETIPTLTGPVAGQPGAFSNGFSCQAARPSSGSSPLGAIRSRAAELAGPNTANNLVAGGFTPCVYRAPATGIYDIVFTGPDGPNSDQNGEISGAVNATSGDFGRSQNSSVTAWDVSVRTDLNNPAVLPGRLFAYYIAANSGANGRNVEYSLVAATQYGFRYRITYNADPFGFIVFANQFGFQNTDGTPLYHNVLADPNAATQDQNQLNELQGGVQLLPPLFPLFFTEPDPAVLSFLQLPLTPVVPALTGLSFTGSQGGNVSLIGSGGTFTFTTSQAGSYAVVISRDGVNYDPENPRNALIRGIADQAGSITVEWDGRSNNDEVFPVGEYNGQVAVQGGEVHFPFLDFENNVLGGPTIQLLNPPDVNGDGTGECPPWNGGCFGAFYDDSGYRTASGILVGTSVDGPLCVGNALNPRGFGNPTQIIKSDQVFGYDTNPATNPDPADRRAFGFEEGGNPRQICTEASGFGDKKGLDLWTYYPSNLLVVPLRIIDQPTAVTLRSFTATAGDNGVTLNWQTGSEIGTAGFQLLRGSSSDRAAATRVTPSLIVARGSATEGASYSFVDSSAVAGQSYYYWLEEVETAGGSNFYGPTRVGPGLSVGNSRVYLPLLRR